MRHKKTKAMADIWLDLVRRANNGFIGTAPLRWPERGDLLPSHCGSLIGDVFVLDTGFRDPLYRLAGTRVCELYGSEQRALPFASRFEGQERDLVVGWVSDLHDEDGMAVLSSRGSTEAGETVPLETLLMPMALKGEAGLRIVGITTAGAKPYWLREQPIVHERLLSTRLIRPWREGSNYETRQVIPHAPSISPPPPHASFRKVGHLHVVEGGNGRTI